MRQNRGIGHCGGGPIARGERKSPVLYGSQRPDSSRRIDRVADGAGQANIGVWEKVRDGNDQVGHVVGARVDIRIASLFAGDAKHFVLDDVAQPKRLEDQVQGTAQRDGLGEIDRNQLVSGDAFGSQPLRIQIDVHTSHTAQCIHDLGQRLVLEAYFHFGPECVMDFLFGWRHTRALFPEPV